MNYHVQDLGKLLLSPLQSVLQDVQKHLQMEIDVERVTQIDKQNSQQLQTDSVKASRVSDNAAHTSESGNTRKIQSANTTDLTPVSHHAGIQQELTMSSVLPRSIHTTLDRSVIQDNSSVQQTGTDASVKQKQASSTVASSIVSTETEQNESIIPLTGQRTVLSELPESVLLNYSNEDMATNLPANEVQNNVADPVQSTYVSETHFNADSNLKNTHNNIFPEVPENAAHNTAVPLVSPAYSDDAAHNTVAPLVNPGYSNNDTNTKPAVLPTAIATNKTVVEQESVQSASTANIAHTLAATAVLLSKTDSTTVPIKAENKAQQTGNSEEILLTNPTPVVLKPEPVNNPAGFNGNTVISVLPFLTGQSSATLNLIAASTEQSLSPEAARQQISTASNATVLIPLRDRASQHSVAGKPEENKSGLNQLPTDIANQFGTAVESALEQAWQLTQEQLQNIPDNSQGTSLVQNTFNVSVNMSNNHSSESIDLAGFEQALSDVLRTAARRQGLEV